MSDLHDKTPCLLPYGSDICLSTGFPIVTKTRLYSLCEKSPMVIEGVRLQIKALLEQITSCLVGEGATLL